MPTNLSGEPYYISIINQETLPPVDPKGKEKKKMDGVIYNIPGKSSGYRIHSKQTLF
mgnify:CR=1 FL=1